MKPETKMSLVAVGFGLLANCTPSQLAETEPVQVAEIIEHAVGNVATTGTTVLEAIETEQAPEQAALEAAESHLQPEDQYLKTVLFPAMEEAGITVHGQNEDVAESINGPGQFIVSTGKFGSQITITDLVEPNGDSSTKTVEVAAYGELAALLDPETYDKNLFRIAEEGEKLPLYHISPGFCDFHFKPDDLKNVVRYIIQANREVVRAYTNNTNINLSDIVSGLPPEGFQCEDAKPAGTAHGG